MAKTLYVHPDSIQQTGYCVTAGWSLWFVWYRYPIAEPQEKFCWFHSQFQQATPCTVLCLVPLSVLACHSLHSSMPGSQSSQQSQAKIIQVLSHIHTLPPTHTHYTYTTHTHTRTTHIQTSATPIYHTTHITHQTTHIT